MIPTSTILLVIAGIVLISGTFIGLIMAVRTYLKYREKESGNLSRNAKAGGRARECRKSRTRCSGGQTRTNSSRPVFLLARARALRTGMSQPD